jgi:hypothetical protein
MSCERYQQLLYFNRPGEISDAESADLRRHLTSCERCSLEWQRIRNADKLLDPLRTFSPAPPDPEKLALDILRRVRQTAPAERSGNVVDRILDLFLIPGIRYSAAAIILFIITTFAFQSWALLDDISALEGQLMSASAQRAGTVYAARSETLREVVRSATGQPLAEALPFNVTDGRIQVPAKVAETYLHDNILRSLPAFIGSSALRIDQRTLERIAREIRATVELTFHAG